ncbi:hypothetical protein L2E82_47516 [Cichorium intybus]|uniref:Uncharacterized protein n=1 Tax=Cichorium intybus TaxID=13427 RepID=A0ACB8YVS8_CICIN|nr:hypothetical protein L2E82_47516 [Cichorium intybus]
MATSSPPIYTQQQTYYPNFEITFFLFEAIKREKGFTISFPVARTVVDTQIYLQHLFYSEAETEKDSLLDLAGVCPHLLLRILLGFLLFRTKVTFADSKRGRFFTSSSNSTPSKPQPVCSETQTSI